jgi:hypothetical protein
MNHDPEALRVALSATIEIPAADDPECNDAIFRFEDSRLRYELHLQPDSGTALLAADPAEPIQACPMFEFSFRCTDIVIGKSAYCMDSKEVAIEFYEGDVSQAGLRLTMYWIPDGYWYIWANANSRPPRPPTAKQSLSTAPSEFELVPDGEFLEVQVPETQLEASRELQLILDPEFL